MHLLSICQSETQKKRPAAKISLDIGAPSIIFALLY